MPRISLTGPEVLAYWFLLAGPGALLFLDNRLSRSQAGAVWITGAILLVLMVGLRHKVGGDWDTYERFVGYALELPPDVALTITDPGYALVNWISAHTFGTPHLVNLVCAVMAVVPLMLFCASRPNRWLSLVVAIPYLVVVVFMGYTKQSAAIGLGFAALMALEHRRIWTAFGAVVLAGLFHRAAVGFVVPIIVMSAYPFGLFGFIRTIFLFVLGLFYIWLILYSPALSSVGVSINIQGYTSEYTTLFSAGALPRLLIGLVAGVAVILLARRRLFAPENFIWVLCALGTLVLIPVALVYSTFADRVGLFLIPLQLHAVGIVDEAIIENRIRLLYRIMIVAICSTILFVWLTHSSYARYWLPYDNVLVHLF